LHLTLGRSRETRAAPSATCLTTHLHLQPISAVGHLTFTLKHIHSLPAGQGQHLWTVVLPQLFCIARHRTASAWCDSSEGRRLGGRTAGVKLTLKPPWSSFPLQGHHFYPPCTSTPTTRAHLPLLFERNIPRATHLQPPPSYIFFHFKFLSPFHFASPAPDRAYTHLSTHHFLTSLYKPQYHSTFIWAGGHATGNTTLPAFAGGGGQENLGKPPKLFEICNDTFDMTGSDTAQPLWLPFHFPFPTTLGQHQLLDALQAVVTSPSIHALLPPWGLQTASSMPALPHGHGTPLNRQAVHWDSCHWDWGGAAACAGRTWRLFSQAPLPPAFPTCPACSNHL